MSFKRLTSDNWLEADPTIAAFATVDRAGVSRPLDGEDLANDLLSVSLSEMVPQDARDLFEVARGTALYGWFFYPLFALADEQLHRAADRALQLRVEELGGPANGSFYRRIGWLHDQGELTDTDVVRWDGIRQLRNVGSHPTFQGLQMPGTVRQSVSILAAAINGLWVESSGGCEARGA